MMREREAGIPWAQCDPELRWMAEYEKPCDYLVSDSNTVTRHAFDLAEFGRCGLCGKKEEEDA
jgi:hypothetical protein